MDIKWHREMHDPGLCRGFLLRSCLSRCVTASASLPARQAHERAMSQGIVARSGQALASQAAQGALQIDPVAALPLDLSVVGTHESLRIGPRLLRGSRRAPDPNARLRPAASDRPGWTRAIPVPAFLAVIRLVLPRAFA
jgi:hypothetical protein